MGVELLLYVEIFFWRYFSQIPGGKSEFLYALVLSVSFSINIAKKSYQSFYFLFIYLFFYPLM